MKPNLRLIVLPGTMHNHHFYAKPEGPVSNNFHITDVINSLYVKDNDHTENSDEYVINAFRGCNNNNINTSSNYRNNNSNNASSLQTFNDN